MKRLLLLLCSAGLLNAQETPVTIDWDASPSPMITNYVVYINAISTNSVPIKLNAGTNLTFNIPGLAGGPWFIRITAVDSRGSESLFSNMVTLNFLPLPPLNNRRRL